MTTLYRHHLLRWVDLDGQAPPRDPTNRITVEEWAATRRHLEARPDKWAVIWEGPERYAEHLFDAFTDWDGFQIGIRREGADSQVLARWLTPTTEAGILNGDPTGIRRPSSRVHEPERPRRESPDLTTTVIPPRPKKAKRRVPRETSKKPKKPTRVTPKLRCSCGDLVARHDPSEIILGCRNLR